jgi:hypothetical protein
LIIFTESNSKAEIVEQGDVKGKKGMKSAKWERDSSSL